MVGTAVASFLRPPDVVWDEFGTNYCFGTRVSAAHPSPDSDILACEDMLQDVAPLCPECAVNVKGFDTLQRTLPMLQTGSRLSALQNISTVRNKEFWSALKRGLKGAAKAPPKPAALEGAIAANSPAKDLNASRLVVAAEAPESAKHGATSTVPLPAAEDQYKMLMISAEVRQSANSVKIFCQHGRTSDPAFARSLDRMHGHLQQLLQVIDNFLTTRDSATENYDLWQGIGSKLALQMTERSADMNWQQIIADLQGELQSLDDHCDAPPVAVCVWLCVCGCV